MSWWTLIIGPSEHPWTRVAGLLAHGTAAGAAAIAAWKHRARSPRRPAAFWTTIASVQLFLFLAVRWDWVFEITDHLRERAWAWGLYVNRNAWLGAVTFSVISLLVAGIIAMAWQARRGKGRIAGIVGTGGAAIFFVVQLISWHDSDHILYLPLGPLLLIGWAWLILGAITVLGACLAGR